MLKHLLKQEIKEIIINYKYYNLHILALREKYSKRKLTDKVKNEQNILIQCVYKTLE